MNRRLTYLLAYLDPGNEGTSALTYVLIGIGGLIALAVLGLLVTAAIKYLRQP